MFLDYERPARLVAGRSGQALDSAGAGQVAGLRFVESRGRVGPRCARPRRGTDRAQLAAGASREHVAWRGDISLPAARMLNLYVGATRICTRRRPRALARNARFRSSSVCGSVASERARSRASAGAWRARASPRRLVTTDDLCRSGLEARGLVQRKGFRKQTCEGSARHADVKSGRRSGGPVYSHLHTTSFPSSRVCGLPTW